MYPEIRVPLHHKNNYELLIATILSAQCTDEMVNKVTPDLFRRYANPKELATAPHSEIESLIRRLGLFRGKARSLKSCAKELVEKHNGEVPSTMEALTRLPGVGRKTANLVVTLGYDKAGICVDTHVHRITNRWGLVRTKTPLQTEFALREVLPVRYWKQLNSYLVALGQGICRPISPLCSQCKIRLDCARVGVGHSR